MKFKKYLNEKTNKTVDPKLIDPSKVTDAGSMVDLRDMVRFDNFDPSMYYAVEDELYRVTVDGDIIPIKGVKADYNWSSNTFVIGTEKWEIPPKNLKVGKTLINPNTNAPYVFYHGTSKDFKKFSDEFAGSAFKHMNRFYAHYFTTKKEYALNYGKNLKRAVVKLRNKILHIKDLNKIERKWMNDEKAVNSSDGTIIIPFTDWLMKNGYNMFGVPYKTRGWNEIAVFKADDIVLF